MPRSQRRLSAAATDALTALSTAREIRDAMFEAYRQQPDAMLVSGYTLNPLELLTVDGQSSQVYRVPVEIDDTSGAFKFGSPIPTNGANPFPDLPGMVVPGKPGMSPSLPAPKFGQTASRGVSARDTERILAAVARGAIPPGRVQHWTAQAAAGHDISALDQLAAPAVAAGGLDTVYSKLFGPGAAQDDGGPEYRALFGDGTVSAAQQAADANAAAARSAAAALSDDQLYRLLFRPAGEGE